MHVRWPTPASVWTTSKRLAYVETLVHAKLIAWDKTLLLPRISYTIFLVREHPKVIEIHERVQGWGVEGWSPRREFGGLAPQNRKKIERKKKLESREKKFKINRKKNKSKKWKKFNPVKKKIKIAPPSPNSWLCS